MERGRAKRYYPLLLGLSLLPPLAFPQQEESKPKEKTSTTLHVKVTAKETGKPIKDADVWVKSVDDGKDFDESMPTNAKGVSSLPGVPQGMVLIQVTAKGFLPHSQKFKISEEASSISIDLGPEQKNEPPP